MVRQSLAFAALLAAAACAACRPALPPAPSPLSPEPPPAPRELRAAWVATVTNIDWPSKKGLSTEAQQTEILAILKRARELRLNAIILQVRPSADAIYPSQLEPWTEYLTGREGEPPSPLYDPLAMWIDEAHARGLELHAWFNPYRARHAQSTSPLAWGHVASRHPEIVVRYGGEQLWMDPGATLAEEMTLSAILDVVRRYDIDGVHMDDYFYPYPVTEQGKEIDFPDSGSDADRRRQNVTRLIDRVSTAVHAEKSWMKFGISPFGIGRPDRRPANIRGFSQYDKLYANVEDWLERGVIDYLAPQLYWSVASQNQPFGVLLDTWKAANPKSRAIVPGLFTSRTADGSKSPFANDEIPKQIQLSRQKSAQGNIHFSMRALMANKGGLADRLIENEYREDALVPAMPWLDPTLPGVPSAIPSDDCKHVRITPPMNKRTPSFAIWIRPLRQSKERHFERRDGLHPQTLDVNLADNDVFVSAIDRVGNESARVRVVCR